MYLTSYFSVYILETKVLENSTFTNVMHFDIFYSILFHLKKIVTIYYHKWVKNSHLKDTGRNEQLLHKGYNLSP